MESRSRRRPRGSRTTSRRASPSSPSARSRGAWSRTRPRSISTSPAVPVVVSPADVLRPWISTSTTSATRRCTATSTAPRSAAPGSPCCTSGACTTWCCTRPSVAATSAATCAQMRHDHGPAGAFVARQVVRGLGGEVLPARVRPERAPPRVERGHRRHTRDSSWTRSSAGCPDRPPVHVPLHALALRRRRPRSGRGAARAGPARGGPGGHRPRASPPLEAARRGDPRRGSSPQRDPFPETGGGRCGRRLAPARDVGRRGGAGRGPDPDRPRHHRRPRAPHRCRRHRPRPALSLPGGDVGGPAARPRRGPSRSRHGRHPGGVGVPRGGRGPDRPRPTRGGRARGHDRTPWHDGRPCARPSGAGQGRTSSSITIRRGSPPGS